MKPDEPTSSSKLRQRAESKYDQDHSREIAPTIEVDLQRMLHELQVHQIELEMQNEELMQTREELEDLLRQYTDLYDFARVGYFTLDRDGTILEANLTGAMLLGIERLRLVKRRFGLFVSPESYPEYNSFLNKVFESGATETCEAALLKEGKEQRYLDLEARIAENGEECRLMAVDISARKRTEEELRYLSIHDALTGAYNRGFFEEGMTRLEHGRQFPFSIVMADVDGLKGTNDSLGHAAGDALLKRVVHILTAAFRSEDIIARIGGDEFAAILPNTGAAAAENALRRLQQVLQDHNAANVELPLCLSFGVGVAEKPTPFTVVLKEADENMFIMKRGHNVPGENLRQPEQ